MDDRTVSEDQPAKPEPPDGPEPDNYEWTSEPEAPDDAGMPGEFVEEPGDGVPGVRQHEG